MSYTDSLVNNVVRELSGNLMPYVEVDYRLELDSLDEENKSKTKIRDPAINAVYVPALSRNIGFNLGCHSDLEVMFIERVLVNSKIYNPKYWDISISKYGMNGDEVGSAKLKPHIAALCAAHICEILTLPTLGSRVRRLLVLEYGYLLDSVYSKEWSYEKIRKDQMVFANQERFAELDKEMVDVYKTYPLPRAICVLENSKYRVIDGYHRCAGVEGILSVILGCPKKYKKRKNQLFY
jgi:hypothetical protein